SVYGKVPREIVLRLIEARRLTGRRAEAAALAAQFLIDNPSPSAATGDITIWNNILDTVEEYYFVVRTYGDPKAAAGAVPVTSNLGRPWLWVELARTQIAAGDPGGARRSLGTLWQTLAASQPDEVHPLAYVTGKLISGFLYFDAG